MSEEFETTICIVNNTITDDNTGGTITIRPHDTSVNPIPCEPVTPITPWVYPTYPSYPPYPQIPKITVVPNVPDFPWDSISSFPNIFLDPEKEELKERVGKLERALDELAYSLEKRDAI